MEGRIKVTGRMIRCMEKEYLRGETEEDMKETITRIRSMVLAHSYGLMEDAMKEAGRTISSMAKESMYTRTARRREGSGMKARGHNG